MVPLIFVLDDTLPYIRIEPVPTTEVGGRNDLAKQDVRQEFISARVRLPALLVVPHKIAILTYHDGKRVGLGIQRNLLLTEGGQVYRKLNEVGNKLSLSQWAIVWGRFVDWQADPLLAIPTLLYWVEKL